MPAQIRTASCREAKDARGAPACGHARRAVTKRPVCHACAMLALPCRAMRSENVIATQYVIELPYAMLMLPLLMRRQMRYARAVIHAVTERHARAAAAMRVTSQ